MTGSGRLGVTASVLVLAGGLLSHALDVAGLLPGVHESERVRDFAERGAARPMLYLGCLAGAALAGAVVATLHRGARHLSPRALLAVVVLGQAGLFASFEVTARLAAGHDAGEVFVEPTFLAGVAVQVAIAAAFVLLLLLAGRALVARLALPRNVWRPDTCHLPSRDPRRLPSRRPAHRARGRAPPFLPVPST